MVEVELIKVYLDYQCDAFFSQKLKREERKENEFQIFFHAMQLISLLFLASIMYLQPLYIGCASISHS